METISIKLDKGLSREIGKAMRSNYYSTKTEFIREAIRDKIDDLNGRGKLLENLRRTFGASKRRTTDEDVHKAGEKAFEEIEKELN